MMLEPHTLTPPWCICYFYCYFNSIYFWNPYKLLLLIKYSFKFTHIFTMLITFYFFKICPFIWDHTFSCSVSLFQRVLQVAKLSGRGLTSSSIIESGKQLRSERLPTSSWRQNMPEGPGLVSFYRKVVSVALLNLCGCCFHDPRRA